MTTIEQFLTSWRGYQARSQEIRSKYPYYDWACKTIPGYKTVAGNLAFRKRCIATAEINEDYAHQLWMMSSRDLLFFINTFCFTFDPDLVPASTVIPFITYEFQDVALDEMCLAIIEKYDELIEKSRRMGVTWMALAIQVWYWKFKEYSTFRLLSMKEELVDTPNSTDTLFWKILFLIDHLPGFLKSEHYHTHLSLLNKDNRATMKGYSTTSDSARSGRCTIMFLDEFSSVPDGDGIEKATQAVCKCRLFNSTHQGPATTFYRLSIKPTIKKLILHWSCHPLYNPGLYYWDGHKIVIANEFKGKVTVTRETYNFPEEYPFRKDGKLRSPWYDNECDRASHPMQIAQELDIDPFASDFLYFDDPDIVPRIEKEDVRPPFLEGELEYDSTTLEPIRFIEGKNGYLRLWINPDVNGKLPEDLQAACGVDISAGTGASNSTATFGNLVTGEKIAEYANSFIKPESYAKLAVAMCKWFNEAFMVFDGGGPGLTFGDEVMRFRYQNIYYRRDEHKISKKMTGTPGVFLNPAEKKAILDQYRKALKERRFIQRSSIANQECMSYVWTSGGNIAHSSSNNAVDPSGAGSSHGDRVIADALFVKGMNFLSGHSINGLQPPEKPQPQFCYASRRDAREEKAAAKKKW